MLQIPLLLRVMGRRPWVNWEVKNTSLARGALMLKVTLGVIGRAGAPSGLRPPIPGKRGIEWMMGDSRPPSMAPPV